MNQHGANSQLTRRVRVPYYSSDFEKNEMGWDLTPSSMIRLLEIFADRYPKVPLIITESGTADTTDQLRVRYISAILQQIHGLIESKQIDLRGYLIWTLMDNFEWAEGFRPKFGLLETNFETLERKERKDTCDMLRDVFGKKSY
jgi:beta-glucosidase